MRSTAQTVRKQLAALLLAGYGLFWAMWVTHPFWTHEGHLNAPETNPNNRFFTETQIETEKNHAPECKICQLLPAQSDAVHSVELIPLSERPANTPPSFKPTLLVLNEPENGYLRGPPQ